MELDEKEKIDLAEWLREDLQKRLRECFYRSLVESVVVPFPFTRKPVDLAKITVEEKPMRWIEVPAQRVLEVGETELLDHFDAYSEAGECGWSQFYTYGSYSMNKVYRFRRKSNGEMFQHADVISYQNRVGCYYLKPLL